MNIEETQLKMKKATFMRKIGFWISFAPSMLMYAWIRYYYSDSSEQILIYFTILALLLFSIGIYLMIKYWRCPVCHKQLPRGSSNSISYCNHCGSKLDF